jgi:hypothetical protein
MKQKEIRNMSDFEPKVERLKTFGDAVQSYRIVRPEGGSPRARPTRDIKRTENAKRLGEELLKQFRETDYQSDSPVG